MVHCHEPSVTIDHDVCMRLRYREGWYFCNAKDLIEIPYIIEYDVGTKVIGIIRVPAKRSEKVNTRQRIHPVPDLLKCVLLAEPGDAVFVREIAGKVIFFHVPRISHFVPYCCCSL